MNRQWVKPDQPLDRFSTLLRRLCGSGLPEQSLRRYLPEHNSREYQASEEIHRRFAAKGRIKLRRFVIMFLITQV